MNRDTLTPQAFQDQLAEIQEIMEREKVELTPEVQDYLKQQIQRITEMITQGQMPSEKDLEFFEEVKTWMNMPKEWRIESPDIKDALQSGKIDKFKECVSDAKERDVSLKQWLSLLHVAEADKKDKGWIDHTFEFPGGSRIYCKSSLYLRHCPTLTHLPDNLTIRGVLSLDGCTSLTHLPDNLTTKKSLHLTRCISLTDLPDNLNIKGNLTLDNCTSLTHLPNDIYVGSGIFLYGNLNEQVIKDAKRLFDEDKIIIR